MQSAVAFNEQQYEAYTVTTAALGNFATKALFSAEQRMHIDQWRGWAAAHLTRLQSFDVSSRDVHRLAAISEVVAKMVGDPRLLFRLGWCTAYHGRQLRLAYRVCKVPENGPCVMMTITYEGGQTYIRRERTIGVW